MVTIDSLNWRGLTSSDVDDAVALNAEAGWNQIIDDWRFMLDQGEGVGVLDAGDLIASSMLLPQGDRFAWIAMILVTAEWQRKGLASQLMRRCIARADALNLIAGLDATEAGRQVYMPLGFNDIYPLTRWQADGPKATLSGNVRSMLASDLEAVAERDMIISGAPRLGLLSHLHGRCPERAFILERDGVLHGFVLARNGRLATQIGPLSADNGTTALALLQAALANQTGKVFLDAADHHAGLADWLADAGFIRQRGYMRMLLGPNEPIDDPNQVYLIAGPELG